VTGTPWPTALSTRSALVFAAHPTRGTVVPPHHTTNTDLAPLIAVVAVIGAIFFIQRYVIPWLFATPERAAVTVGVAITLVFAGVELFSRRADAGGLLPLYLALMAAVVAMYVPTFVKSRVLNTRRRRVMAYVLTAVAIGILLALITGSKH
jgi:hypothetical protein